MILARNNGPRKKQWMTHADFLFRGESHNTAKGGKTCFPLSSNCALFEKTGFYITLNHMYEFVISSLISY